MLIRMNAREPNEARAARRRAGSRRPFRRSRRPAARILAAVALLASLTFAVAGTGPAAGQTPPPGQGKPDTGRLTSRLAELATLAAPPGPGPAPRLPARARPDNVAGGLQRPSAGHVVVDVRVDDVGQGIQARLRAAGAEILAVSEPALQTITASVADTDLVRLGDVRGVQNVREVHAPMAHACAPLISEGDAQLKTALARSQFGVDGAGVTVGIVSDSYNRSPAGAVTNAAGDVAAGELPGAANPCGRLNAVNVLDDSHGPPVIDEGRAMAQTVHDLAPGARIAFATDGVSETSFANNITALASSGAKVIVDDIGFLAEPFYQDGPVANAVNAARAGGVAYFSAAGNETIVLGGKDVGSYEAITYRSTTCPSLPDPYLDCHDFNPGASVDATSAMTVRNNGYLTLDLQWAQPRGGVTTDLDIFVLDQTTGEVLAASNDSNTGATGTQVPYELVDYRNTTGATKTVNVVVGRYAGAPVRFRNLHLDSDITAVEYSTPTASDVFGPTIFGHAGTAGAFSIGAVPYNNSAVPEPYSSKGPVTLLFAPVPSTAPLAAPQVLAKPDFVATDCVQNSFFPPGSSSPHRFCGTSDAAPHAAAVAALLLQGAPGLTPAQLGAALASTASPVGSSPVTTVGAGLLNASLALGVVTTADPTGHYRPLTPARILDTRDGTGGIAGPVGAGSTVEVQITGRGGIPATGVSAVAMNVTVTQPTAAGFLTLYPAGAALPLAANLNFLPGQTVPNLVVVKVGAGGKVATYNPAGSTHVIFDVAGWYADSTPTSDGRYEPLVPARILDTRDGTGGGVRLGPGASLDLQVSGRGGVPGAGAQAAVFDVAVTNATAPSYLTVYPTGLPRPLAANLNYVGGETLANRVMATLGTGGKVTIFNAAGSADVVVDVGGWYSDSSVAGALGSYRALVPARIVDTRTGTGRPAGAIAGGTTAQIQVTGRGGVPASGVRAVILNVTVTQPAAPGYLTLFPAGAAQPLASDLNFAAGETRPNLVVAQVGAGGQVSLFAAATTHVVIDVAGWFT